MTAASHPGDSCAASSFLFFSSSRSVPSCLPRLRPPRLPRHVLPRLPSRPAATSSSSTSSSPTAPARTCTVFSSPTSSSPKKRAAADSLLRGAHGSPSAGSSRTSPRAPTRRLHQLHPGPQQLFAERPPARHLEHATAGSGLRPPAAHQISEVRSPGKPDRHLRSHKPPHLPAGLHLRSRHPSRRRRQEERSCFAGDRQSRTRSEARSSRRR